MVNEFKLTVVHFARAAGPRGRRGPWAVGLLLAKPALRWGIDRKWEIDSIKEPFRGRSCTLCKEFLIQTIVARFYSGNDEHQMVPLSSLMINLPVKFIRGKLSTFLAGWITCFMKRRSALQIVCFNNITFSTNILCQFNNFYRFKAFCRPVGKSALRATFHLGHWSNRISF